jgi:hypothetical protein
LTYDKRESIRKKKVVYLKGNNCRKGEVKGVRGI